MCILVLDQNTIYKVMKKLAREELFSTQSARESQRRKLARARSFFRRLTESDWDRIANGFAKSVPDGWCLTTPISGAKSEA